LNKQARDHEDGNIVKVENQDDDEKRDYNIENDENVHEKGKMPVEKHEQKLIETSEKLPVRCQFRQHFTSSFCAKILVSKK
jgi:hypothetical protein